MMSYASCTEPFRAANLLSSEPLYDVINLSGSQAPIRSSGAGCVFPDTQISDNPMLDYLFVVAGGNPSEFDDSYVFNTLRKHARFGAIIGGISGGPVILAKAGLMKERRMTVHWEHAESLKEEFPDLLIMKSIFIIDRDRVTCAGGTAPMDLMHALISKHQGTSFARLVSDWFLHTEIRPSFGPQRSGLAERVGTTNGAVLNAVELMETHIADPLTLPELAALSNVSPRQLNRRFVNEIECSTMSYYRNLRLEMARNFMRNSSLSLTEISLSTGFDDSSHFSVAFRKNFGETPSTFRRNKHMLSAPTP